MELEEDDDDEEGPLRASGLSTLPHPGSDTAAATEGITITEEAEEETGQAGGAASHVCPLRRADDGDGDQQRGGADRTVDFGHYGGGVSIAGLEWERGGRRGGHRGRGRPAVPITMLDRGTLRRMENIRRGGGEGAVLADGVKSRRRGHLEGGRCSVCTAVSDDVFAAPEELIRHESYQVHRESSGGVALAGNNGCM